MTAERKAWGISAAITIAVALAAIGGFLIGYQPPPSFADKFRSVLAVEANGSSFYEALGNRINDPVAIDATSKLLGIKDRAALDARLKIIPFSPPFHFAPFVGHIARAVTTPGMQVNTAGFRDVERDYSQKAADAVRVFITGGSTAWGSGSVQDDTIAARLERTLNARDDGRRYEVVNAAFPAWSTTQEKILIQQRIGDMKPDLVIMFSGINDVHWTIYHRDVRWFFSYYDQNYLAMINEVHRSDGHPELVTQDLTLSGHRPCQDVAKTTASNVREAAFSAGEAGARLIFALQPNLNFTGTKRLTANEAYFLGTQDRALWAECYPAIAKATSAIVAPNYEMIDLTRLFADGRDGEDVFIDTYHLGAWANGRVADALAGHVKGKSR